MKIPRYVLTHEDQFLTFNAQGVILTDEEEEAYKWPTNEAAWKALKYLLIRYPIAAIREALVEEPEPVAPEPITRPEAPWHLHEFHWLQGERSGAAVAAQWINGAWFSPGDRGSITPAEMRRRGWEWFAPAIAPLHPVYDK